VFKRFKGVKLYEIIDIINEEHGVGWQKTLWSRCTAPRSHACSTRSWRSLPGQMRFWMR
jgi:hypothetical protein